MLRLRIQMESTHYCGYLMLCQMLFFCQINVRYWQITGKYVSFTFQKWTDLGHVLPNCGQCFTIC